MECPFLHSPLPDGEVVFVFLFSALTHLLPEGFLDVHLHTYHLCWHHHHIPALRASFVQ